MPNARILIHQPATEGIYGQVSDLEIQAAEISRMRKLLEATLAKHSGKTPEQVRLDIERDKILTSEEAKEYGIIDEIIQSRKLTPVRVFSGRDTGALVHSTVTRLGSTAAMGSSRASRWHTIVRPPSSSRVCHQQVLPPKKAMLPPAATNASAASRIRLVQYSSWPIET